MFVLIGADLCLCMILGFGRSMQRAVLDYLIAHRHLIGLDRAVVHFQGACAIP